MAVLPNAFRDDKRGLGVELAKNFHPHLLRVYEPVPLRRVITMRAHRRPAFRFERAGEDGLHFFLLWPAFLVRAQAQVAVGHKVHLPWIRMFGRVHIPLTIAAYSFDGKSPARRTRRKQVNSAQARPGLASDFSRF